MGMSFNNLCNTCTNIGCEFQSGIVRTRCAFYMPSQLEPDNCGNYVVMQPTVEAIPKDQYEARLKADMVAMLTEIQLDIKKAEDCGRAFYLGLHMASDIITKKINSLQEQDDGNDN